MARTLYILRHAKSDRGTAGMADIDRPLNARGRREAEEVAALMEARGYQPARILCSSAQRTRETLTPLLPVLTEEATIVLTTSIYDASMATLLGLVREQDDTAKSVLLVGHNPGLEELARILAGRGDEVSRHRLAGMFPPASLAVLDFDASRWTDVGPGLGRLVAFETPSSA